MNERKLNSSIKATTFMFFCYERQNVCVEKKSIS